MKSTVDEIRQRFDTDVERFSNLDTGQSATVDAPLAMALVARAAAAATPHARHVLDVGCGAGNYSLKLLEHLPNLVLPADPWCCGQSPSQLVKFFTVGKRLTSGPTSLSSTNAVFGSIAARRR